jgi:tetratricopeptide (TPR) repeat protein
MVSDERFSKFEAIIALAASTGPEFTWSWNRRGPINLDAARLLPMADNGQLLLDSSYGLHLPPLIGNQLRRLPSILVRIFLWGDLKGGERDIRELLEVNPEGSLYTLHAGLLLGLSRFEEAAEAYELARQTPALFPKMRDEAAVGLAMSRGYLALIEHKDDEDYMRETVPFIRDAARLPTQFPLQSMILATTAQVAGEWDLAGPLIDRWEQENPSDRFNINYRRAEVEFGSGRYTRAIEAANVVLGAEIPDKALTEKRHQRVHEIIRLSRIELQKALRNTANADEGSPSNASSDR